MTDDLVATFRQAVEEFGRRLALVGAGQLADPTPNTDWDVRDLVNHVLGENLWALPLLDGSTIAEVGDRFDGDQVGDDPQAAWAAATAASVAAVSAPGALERTVHVSFGDISAREYVSQLACDHTIHSWDLARALGADERIEPGLVIFAASFLGPQVEAWRSAGLLGPAVELGPGADAQSQLLALTGRRP